MAQRERGVTYSTEYPDVPRANLRHGLVTFAMPEWGPAIEGKTRQNWVVDHRGEKLRVLVATDRISSNDRVVAAVPHIGKVRNLISAFWFQEMRDILPSHVLHIPHPNVLIARQADLALPVEFILRSHMAASDTGTSIARNYREGKKVIYGQTFPDGLEENRPFPKELGRDGVIFTPTTKAAGGEHDQMLTIPEAKEIIDAVCGDGFFEEAVEACYEMYTRATRKLRELGFILADTKIELGIIDGKLVIIDELFSSDTSRIWVAETYEQRLKDKKKPDNLDKQLLRDEVSSRGWQGEGPVPLLPLEVLFNISERYEELYTAITGLEIPEIGSTPGRIRHSLTEYFGIAA